MKKYKKMSYKKYNLVIPAAKFQEQLWHRLSSNCEGPLDFGIDNGYTQIFRRMQTARAESIRHLTRAGRRYRLRVRSGCKQMTNDGGGYWLPSLPFCLCPHSFLSIKELSSAISLSICLARFSTRRRVHSPNIFH
jgi:hypothetical protein